MKSFLEKHQIHILFLLGFLLFILLRFPSFLEPHWYGDEGIYASVASEIEHGDVLYRDIWDNKPPLIYLTYLLAGNVNRLFNIKILNFLAASLSLLGIYKILSKLFQKPKIVFPAFYLAIILLGLPILEGNIANAENFFMPLIIWSYYFLLEKRKDSHFTFLSGIMFGFAFLFKPIALLDFFPFLLFLSLYLMKLSSSKFKISKFLPLLFPILGFFIPLLLTVLYELLTHNLMNFIQAVFLDMFSYINWIDPEKPLLFKILYNSYFKLSLFLIVNFTLVCLFIKKKISSRAFLIFLIFASELLAVFVSSRLYAHYLLQILPGFIFLIALIIEKVKISKNSPVKKYFAFIAFAFLCLLLFLSSKNINRITKTLSRFQKYYTYSYQYYFTKNISYDTYDSFFDSNESKLRLLKNSLENRYSGISSVYIYTDHGWTYDYLDLENSTPFCVSYHRYLKENGNNDLYQALLENPPEIIITYHNLSTFPEFNQFLNNYQLDYKDKFYEYYLKI